MWWTSDTPLRLHFWTQKGQGPEEVRLSERGSGQGIIKGLEEDFSNNSEFDKKAKAETFCKYFPSFGGHDLK